MSDSKSTLNEALGLLKRERDELKLQMHLASMEAKDEYDRISDKVDELGKQYEPVSDAVEETAENIFAALGMAAEELKLGFARVRKAISEDEK